MVHRPAPLRPACPSPQQGPRVPEAGKRKKNPPPPPAAAAAARGSQPRSRRTFGPQTHRAARGACSPGRAFGGAGRCPCRRGTAGSGRGGERRTTSRPARARSRCAPTGAPSARAVVHARAPVQTPAVVRADTGEKKERQVQQELRTAFVWASSTRCCGACFPVDHRTATPSGESRRTRGARHHAINPRLHTSAYRNRRHDRMIKTNSRRQSKPNLVYPPARLSHHRP